MLQKDFKWTRKTLTFLAALAIKQNVPHIAVEIISTIRLSRYIDVRCLTIMAYADLKKFDEIVPILRMSLDDQTVKDIYFYDVVCIQYIIKSYKSCKKTSHYIIFY